MKLVDTKALANFLKYLREKFVAPYASKDVDGNDIKDSYLKVGATAVRSLEADHASKADLSYFLLGSKTAPESPQENQVWFDTTENKIKAYNGSSWVELGSGATQS